MNAFTRRLHGALKAGASFLNPGLTPVPPPMDARRWLMEAVMPLEDRIMLDAEPVATIAAPDGSSVLLGDSFVLNVTFDNVPDADPGNHVGYAPYVDLYIPHLGKDGGSSAPTDGVNFVSATYLNAPVQSTLLTFDANGRATHPFARDGSGQLRILTGDPGDQVVVLRLPFGSFTATQPAITMAVNLELSPLADFAPDYVSANLEFSAQAGFALGRDPLNNPTVDPPLLQPVPDTLEITPALIELTKVSDAPRSETATGPNYVRSYTINVNIADQQQVQDLQLTDIFSTNIVFLDATITSGGGTIVQQPAAGEVVSSASDRLIVDFGMLTGGAGNEAQVQVRFYVNDLNGDSGQPVLDPESGSPSLTLNDVQASGVHIPLDPRDAQQPFVENIAPIDNVIVNRSIAVRKDIAIAVDNNVIGLSPGDVLEYTLHVDLSDYFSFGDIILEDILSRGQMFDPSFSPHLVLTERGVTTSADFTGHPDVGGTFVGPNINIVENSVNGQTTIDFNLSGEIILQNLSGGDGVLEGGRTYPDDALQGIGPTMAVITFRTIVLPHAPDGQGGTVTIDQGDRIGNRVNVNASVYPNGNPAGPATGQQGDDDSASLRINTGALSLKTVYAVNGDTNLVIGPGGLPQITQGDTITFRLQYFLPTSSVHAFSLVDYLPLPVLTATGLVQGTAGTVPASGEFVIGNLDTFSALTNAPSPVITFDPEANGIRFNYGTYSYQEQAPGNVPIPSLIDLLFTLTVNDMSYGDGLFLTNLLQGTESNSEGEQTITSVIAQFEVGEAALTIRKGVVDYAGNSSASFVGSRQPSGVSFENATGSGATAAFTGLITDQALATGLIDADLTGIDAGDKVTFALTVNNDGAGNRGAFDVIVNDTLPVGFAIPTDPAGLNLKVTYGDGTAVPYTLLPGGLFGGGIQLIDGADGALGPDPAKGQGGTTTNDIVIITYDLIATPAVQPRQTWTNTGEILNFAGQEGGNSLIQDRLTDTATVSISPVTAAKALLSTSETFTPGSDLAIGEVATFRLTYVLPEGQTNALVLSDLLPLGVAGTLGDVSATVISVGSAISGTGVPAAGSSIAFDAVNHRYTADFGNVSVASDTGTADRTIVIDVSARAVDVVENVRGLTPQNRADAQYVTTNQDGGTTTHLESAGTAVRLVAPDLVLGKTANPTTIVEAGEVVTYTLVISNPTHAAGSTAFGLRMQDSDLLTPLGFTNVTILSRDFSGAVNAQATVDANQVVTITADSLANGGHITVVFTAKSSPGLSAGAVLDNTATLDPYTTLPSDSADIGNARILTESPVTARVQLLGADLEKLIFTTSVGNDADSRVQIGEVVTFDLRISLPSSVTPVTLTDLAPPGLALQSATLHSIGGVTTAGVTAGGNISGSAIAVGNAAAISDNGFTFNFGTLTIHEDGMRAVTEGDIIIVRATALVLDVPGNMGKTVANQTVLTNTATVNFGQGTASAASSVRVVEPDIVLNKQGNRPQAQAGQTETYTVNVTNRGLGTAFDLSLSDILDPRLLLNSNITLAGAVSGSYASFTEIPAITLGTGASFTVSYSALILDTAVLGTNISNTIDASFDSLPGSLPGSRAGDATSQFLVNVSGPSTLTKSVVWTSIGGDADPHVQIGEVVEFRVVASIPNGTTSLTLSDTLPTGLQLVSGSVSLQSFLGDPNYSSFTVNTVGQTTTLDFGTVTNPAAGADDTIVFTLRATVLNVAENGSGDVLRNSATVTPGPLSPVTGTVDVTIVEPDIVIDKIGLGPHNQAGEIVRYTVLIRNAGTGTAFDLTLADPLASDLSLLPGSIVVGAGAGSAAGTYNSFADIHVEQLAAGGSFLVSYEALVLDSARLGSTIANTATTNFDSLPGEANVGRQPATPPSDTAFISVTGPVTLDKTLVNSSIGNDTDPHVQIGELLTFRLVATLPDGTTNLSFADTLPAGIQYVLGSFRAISMFGAPAPAGTLVEGSTVTLGFGQITNPSANPNNQVILEIQGIVMDVPGNIAGTVLTNSGSVSTNIGIFSDTESVVIVDPVLTVDKSALVNGGLQGDAGDIVTYTVLVANDAAVSTGVAYDYAFADQLPPGVQLVGTPTLSGSGAAGATLDLSQPNTVRVTGDSLALGESLTITYTARILDSAQVPGSITNVGAVDYDTLPGPGGADRSASDDATIIVTGPQGFSKTIVATDNPTTGSDQFDPIVTDATIGETITFNLIANLPEGTIGPVVITDSLLSPAGFGTLAPVAGSYTVTVNGITSAITPTLSDTDGDGIADRLVFDLGTLTIEGDNDPNDNDVLIRYQAIVPDVPDNFAGFGRVLVQGASLSTPLGTLSAGTQLEVVEPELLVVKTADVTSAQPGDIVTYTVTLRHAADSTAAAQDLIFTDLLAGGRLALVPGSLVVLSGPGTVTGSSVDVPTLLLGQETVIRYSAIVQAGPDTVPGSVVTNSGIADFDSQPGTGGRPDTATGSVDVTIPGFVKAITGTSNPDTGDIHFTPGAPDLAIGETVTYTLTVTLAPGLTNLSVSDTLLGTGSTGLLQLAATPTILLGTGVTATVPNPVLQESDTDGDGRTDALAWDFGSVTNASGTPSTITITVVARAQDIPADTIPVGNGAGDTLLLPAAMNYGSGTIQSSVTVDIVEPDVGILKTVDVTEVDAGDPLTYTLVLTNGGTGPAYNIDLTDILPPDISFTGAPVTVTGAFNGTFASLDAVAVARLLPGESITVTYHALVGNGVSPGDVLPNSAEAASTSMPGLDPEARDYVVGPAVAPVTVVGDFTLSKDISVAGTSLVDTGDAAIRAGIADLAIGEHATVVLTVALPEGTVHQLVVEDLLASGDALLGLLSGSVTATLGGVDIPVTVLEIDDNSDGVTDRLRFDFGTVVNPGDNDPGNDAIILTYTGIALNRPGNDNGDELDLPATLTWAVPANPAGRDDASASVDLVEPDLALVKSVDRSTADAGDILTYTLQLSNTGPAPAYDISLADLLPPNLSFTADAVTVTGAINGSFTSLDSVALARLMPGESVTITYHAVVGNGVSVGDTLTNSATAENSSLPGTDPDERDYITPPSQATTTIVGDYTLAKEIAVAGTSLADTGDAALRAGIADLAIGEHATVVLRVGLTEGTAYDLVVEDLLSSGDSLLGLLPGSVTATLGGVDIPVTILEIDDNADGVTDRLRFDFGTVVDPGDNDPGNDTIVLTYTAIALNRPGNDSGDELDLPATLSWSVPANPDNRRDASAGVDLVEPELVLVKSFTPTTGEAGDLISYRLTIANNGLGPVYDLGVTDLADPGLMLVGGYSFTQGGVTTSVASLADLPLLRLMPGETVTIDYVQQIADTPLVGATLVNTATVTGDSLPGADPDERDAVPASDTAAITLTPTVPVRISKIIPVPSTDDPNTHAEQFRPDITDFTIGESGTVFLKITLPKGTTGDIVVTDALSSPEGLLGFKTGSIVASLGGVVLDPASYTVTEVDIDGDLRTDQLRFSFGDIVIPGNVDPTLHTLDIRYDVQMQNLLRNQPGDMLDLPVQLDYVTALGAASRLTAASGIDIVLGSPVTMKLSVKAEGDSGSLNGIGPAPGELSGTAGDIFTYTLHVQHNDRATGPAYDLSVRDLLPAGLELIAGSASVDIAGATLSTGPDGLVVTLAELRLDQSFTITYQARIIDATLWNSALTNEVYLDFDSFPGTGGRPGGSSDSFTVFSFGEATIRTDIVSTDNPNSGIGAVQPGVTDLGIGEQVVWRLTTTLNEGTTDSFIITHRLPSGPDGVISIESLAAPVLGAGITAERANPDAQLSDSDGDGIADTIVWDFGRVTNAGDNIIDARDTITIDIVGRVPDDPRNVQGDILDTGSEVDFGTATGPGYDVSGVPVAIVESALVIDKTVPPGDILPGNLISYTIRVSNADHALLAASDIVITDLLQPGLTLEGPITIVSGPDGTLVNGTTVTTPLLPLGQEIVITYSARLAFELDPTQPVVNTAVVTWDSQPGNGGRPGEATDSVVIDLLIPPSPPTPNSLDGSARQSVEDWIARRFIEVPTTAIYSGAAQPGARVVLNIPDALGSMAQVAAATADAGGNWIVRASGVTASSSHSDYSIEDYFASTRLFAAEDPMFVDHPDWADAPRSFAVPVGTHPSPAARPIGLEAVQPAWALAGSEAAPVRLHHLPGQLGLSFASEPLTVDKVMREAASASVADAFARDRWGVGIDAVNRFNAHSLDKGALDRVSLNMGAN